MIPVQKQVINMRQWEQPTPLYPRAVYEAAKIASGAVEQCNAELFDGQALKWSQFSDERKNLALERVEALRTGQQPTSYGDREVDTLFRCVAIAALRHEGAIK